VPDTPALPRATPATALVRVEVEQAPGPGIDFEHDRGIGLVGRRARPGGLWLGFDRAALVDSDDGRGRRVPVLVASPASTFSGARLEVELSGCWSAASGPILVGRVPGGPMPVPGLSRVAGLIEDGATWLDREAAEAEARRAHRRYRERASHARISGGRAWRPSGALPPEAARFATPHSAAEYSLTRLPPRFIRGFEGLLDDDERLLYWIERPMLTDVGILGRLRDRVDRRSALLALTDKQVLWMVDHAQPDRYLSDWGIDAELLPVERVLDVGCIARGGIVELGLDTSAGRRSYTLPIELIEEAQVMRDLVARFRPAVGGGLPRRTYSIEPVAFDAEAASRFGQEAQARAMFEAVAAEGAVLGFLFSPRRPGQRAATAIGLTAERIVVLGPTRRSVELGRVVAVGETLSALVGRIRVTSDLQLTYPAPLVDRGALFARQARRALAMAI
jgi:hypothetical protein